MQSAATRVCGVTTRTPSENWISTKSSALMEQHHQVPPGSSDNRRRRAARRELKQQLQLDKEEWWVKIAVEMETAAVAGNSQRVFKLIRDTGGRRIPVSETICDKNGNLIHNQARRLERWLSISRNSLADLQPKTRPPPDRPNPNGWFRLSLHPKRKLGNIYMVLSDAKLPDRSCADHRGISLIPVVSTLLATIVLRHLTPIREKNIREEQAAFRPGRSCIDQIFTLRLVLESRHVYQRPTIAATVAMNWLQSRIEFNFPAALINTSI
ncbi:hypothetical protein SRHO_G00083580 [Serrasalmus rhombeus]